MHVSSVISSIWHMLLHDIIYDWLIFYIYHCALNSTFHIVIAKWLSFEWLDNATYLSRICLNLIEGQLKFSHMKGNWNVLSLRSVFSADQSGVIINLLSCCLFLSTCIYGIVPDSFKWPDVYLLSLLAPGIFGKLNKRMKNRMGLGRVFSSYPHWWGIFKAKYFLFIICPFITNTTYDNCYPFLNNVRLKDLVKVSLLFTFWIQ